MNNEHNLLYRVCVQLVGERPNHLTTAGKKKRLKADESRERLIQAGLRALAEQGMSIGLDSVNLEQAVRDADVPRSSAYVIWSIDEDYNPQDLFQRAVLMRAIEGRRETTEMLMVQIEEFLANPPEGLSGDAFRRELLRVAGNASIRNVAESKTWNMVFAMRSILNTAQPANRDEELLSWMEESEEKARLETIENLYKPMAEVFGYEPRPEYGERAWHLIEIASSSLMEGLSMRHPLQVKEYLYDLRNPAVPEDGDNWSLYGLLFETIVDQFFDKVEPADGV